MAAIIPPRQFVRFIDQRTTDDWFVIGNVPLHLGGHIGAHTIELKIEHQYAKKLIEKHGLKYEHFSMVQTTIDRGWCGPHNGDLLFVYADDDHFHTHFKLAIKEANNGKELWLLTFHPVSTEKVKYEMRKYGPII